jgi:SAM-dependent methyltransferase
MSANKSAWQTKELTTAFLDGVRGAIPGAVLQFAVIRKIAELWFPEPARILDLGCGDGILGRLMLETFPGATAVFADFSEPMLEAARAKLGDDPRAKVTRVDFSTPEWLEEVAFGTPFDIAVSGFAIHHRPDGEKRRIYSEVFELAIFGGRKSG